MGNILGILGLIGDLNIKLDSFDKLWFTNEELDIILNDEMVNRNYKYLREGKGVRSYRESHECNNSLITKTKKHVTFDDNCNGLMSKGVYAKQVNESWLERIDMY